MWAQMCADAGAGWVVPMGRTGEMAAADRGDCCRPRQPVEQAERACISRPTTISKTEFTLEAYRAERRWTRYGQTSARGNGSR
jgi:hypothetical protein